jgi:hypothetical protein
MEDVITTMLKEAVDAIGRGETPHLIFGYEGGHFAVKAIGAAGSRSVLALTLVNGSTVYTLKADLKAVIVKAQ